MTHHFKARFLPCGIIAVILVLLWAMNLRTSTSIAHSSLVKADKRAPTAPEEACGTLALVATPERTDDPVTRLASVASEHLRKWQEEDDPKLREIRAEELSALLRGADLKQIADELPADVLDFALGMPVFQQWIAAHPTDAALWMSQHPGIADTRVSGLIQNWSRSNAAAAQQYAEELPRGAWKDKVVAVMARESLKSDPKEAIEWADELSSGPVQTGLLRNAIASWGQSDFQTAATWIGQIGDPILKDQLTESLAVTHAAADPESAINFAAESVQEPALLANAVADITAIWAAQAPEKAGQWVEQLPDGNGRRMALGELINVWGAQSSNDLAAWIDGMPKGSLRDEATQFSQVLTHQPPIQ